MLHHRTDRCIRSSNFFHRCCYIGTACCLDRRLNHSAVSPHLTARCPQPGEAVCWHFANMTTACSGGFGGRAGIHHQQASVVMRESGNAVLSRRTQQWIPRSQRAPQLWAGKPGGHIVTLLGGRMDGNEPRAAKSGDHDQHLVKMQSKTASQRPSCVGELSMD
ncbi:unnamed protein product, partial [Ectocarpus sp. 8 AP-2014]